VAFRILPIYCRKVGSEHMSIVSLNQPNLLSKMNERLVLRLIQNRGPLTRSEMSKSIGITFPTVAKAVSSLLDLNLLEEIDEASPGPGRPAKRLRLACESSQVIGVTLSGSECSVAAAGLNGIIDEDSSLSFPTPTTYDSLLVSIVSSIKQLMSSERTTLGVGVSVPAIIDYQEQRAVLSANLPLINGKSIGRDLQALLGLECVIVHDSHALSLSERLHGKAKGVSNFAMLDLCTGIGLGLMVDGRFLTGDSGFAGELGHISIVPDGDMCHCGNRGCLETVASEWSLKARVSLLTKRPVEINEILDMAQSGNKQVHMELEKMCDYLAIGVAHVVNIVNPGTFYICGRIFEAYPELLESLVKKTKQHAIGPSFSACDFVHASGGLLDGTVTCVINYLTDSLVPNLDGYVSSVGVGDSCN
jgi:predicted NBD/HSP70 family sugar kinase